MHKYQSHKVVEAALITSVTKWHDGALKFELHGEDEPRYLQGDKRDRWELALREAHPDQDYSTDLFVGGYWVVYPPEGYESWHPADFPDNYALEQPSSGKSKIAGYRELDKETIELMNEVKAYGVSLGKLVEHLRTREPGEIDQRWVSIGATDLQTGLMALTRAIAKPEFF